MAAKGQKVQLYLVNAYPNEKVNHTPQRESDALRYDGENNFNVESIICEIKRKKNTLEMAQDNSCNFIQGTSHMLEKLN